MESYGDRAKTVSFAHVHLAELAEAAWLKGSKWSKGTWCRLLAELDKAALLAELDKAALLAELDKAACANAGGRISKTWIPNLLRLINGAGTSSKVESIKVMRRESRERRQERSESSLQRRSALQSFGLDS